MKDLTTVEPHKGNGSSNIFITDSNQESKSNSEQNKIQIDQYEKTGYHKASQLNGNLDMLKVNLEKLFEKSRKESIEEKQDLEKAKIPLRNKLEKIKTDKEKLTNRNLKINDELIPELKKENKDYYKEISNIKKDPESVISEDYKSFNAPKFYIGLSFIIPLSIYLYLFYVSATYSAFFKNIGESLTSLSNNTEVMYLFNTIFAADAITNLSANMFSLILILVSPFMVFTLGFVLHHLIEKKNYKAVILVLLFTLFFDGLLAYHIMANIYETKYLTGLIDSKWSINLMLHSGEFYLILSAGFAIYIFWGYLFHIVLAEWENNKPITGAIKKLYSQIAVNRNDITQLKSELETNEIKISNLAEEEHKTENLIQNLILVDFNEFKLRALSFLTGWCKYLSFANENSESNISRAVDYTNNYISNLNVQTNLEG